MQIANLLFTILFAFFLLRLIEERVHKFVIEKYIEISKSISINISSGIVCADPDPHVYNVTKQ